MLNIIRTVIDKYYNVFFYNIRPMICLLSKKYKQPLTGIEIGTYDGKNAKYMFKLLNLKKLYCIDPFKPYLVIRNTGESNVQRDDMPSIYDIAKKNLYRYKDKILFIKKYSDDAINDVPIVDFVYIDGDHRYEQVKKDIENYYPKARLVIGGDNFPNHGVALAVLDFVKKNNLELYTDNQDWWINKC